MADHPKQDEKAAAAAEKAFQAEQADSEKLREDIKAAGFDPESQDAMKSIVRAGLAAKMAEGAPHLRNADYSGPLTGAQALERIEKFGPLCGRETKPATAETKTVGAETKSGK